MVLLCVNNIVYAIIFTTTTETKYLIISMQVNLKLNNVYRFTKSSKEHVSFVILKALYKFVLMLSICFQCKSIQCFLMLIVN